VLQLGKRQELFATLVPSLLTKAFELGFQVRIGDCFRDPRVHGAYGEDGGTYSSVNSEHKNKCAVDLNLFKDGVYLTTTADHKELGEWWDKQHTHTRWGGHYDDANHYEVIDL
jgi:hypothetical protein